MKATREEMEKIKHDREHEDLLKAVEGGDADIQEKLGDSYRVWYQDYEKAAYWLSLAAEQGNMEAQFNLANMYLNGQGVNEDLYIALKLFRKAHAQGHPNAQDFIDRFLYSSTYMKGMAKMRFQISAIRDLAIKHRITLACEKNRLTYKDAYGCVIGDKWFKEGIDYFINVVALHEIRFDADDIECYHAEIVELIDAIAQEALYEIDSSHHEIVYDDSMTGIEYENYCKQILERNGWSTQITKATGDQGVDLIASQDRLRVAIQCKKSASAIGNKAVQEVVSGAKHYSINHAIVVSNSTFTPQAWALATTNHVYLIHHFELPELYSRISKS